LKEGVKGELTMKWIRTIKRYLKRHGHHFVLGISLLSLGLLITWWTIFIDRSIIREKNLLMENLNSTLKYFVLKISMDTKTTPVTGIYPRDDRFEILECGVSREPLKKVLKPGWPNLCIRVRPEVMESLEEDFNKKKLMLFGESRLLLIIVILGCFMLYRHLQLEKRAAREVGEFWRRVTHEIKTPITGIKAFLQSIKNHCITPEQLPKYVDMALTQIEKQEQLAENILAGYGLHSNEQVYNPFFIHLNLDEFLTGYFEHHNLLLTDATLKLELFSQKGPDAATGESEGTTLSPLMVKADTQLLKIILDNIVDNALKYCSPGLVLTVETFIKGKFAIILIRDNGPGIPQNDFDKVFEAYKHLDKELPGKLHGSGMGLYISRKLAEKMSGTLEINFQDPGVKEQTPSGTGFLIHLPLIKPNRRN